MSKELTIFMCDPDESRQPGVHHADDPFEILPNDNEKVRERNGRIYVSHRRTWTLVQSGECLGEYATRREAANEARKRDAFYVATATNEKARRA